MRIQGTTADRTRAGWGRAWTVLLAGLFLPLAGCNRDSTAGNAAATGDGRPLVVCTTTMIADLARQVGGARVRVESIMPPGTDPHIYDPKPDDSILFRKAALVLYNGLHLEGKMVHMFENAGAKAVALAEDPRIKARESAQARGAPDPHCWWNARHFMVYAQRACDALVRMDPAGEAEYRERTRAYLAALEKLDAQIKAAVERIPPTQRYLVTSHDAFFYYGDAYGLKVDAVLGISTDAQVNALRLTELARLIVQQRVPALFHETSVSAALNQMVDQVMELARKQGHEVRVPPEPLYSDSLGKPGTPAETYLGALRENTRIIVTALAGKEAAQTLAAENRQD